MDLLSSPNIQQFNPMPTSVFEDAKKFVQEKFSSELPAKFFYHDWNHTLQVTQAAADISQAAGINKSDQEKLLIAALFHDTGFTTNPAQHEEASKLIARGFLIRHNVQEDDIQTIESIIDVTKVGRTPNSQLEAIMKDADMIHLSSPDHQVWAERLHQDMEVLQGQKIKKKAWKKTNYDFIKQHRYYTPEAQRLYEANKLANLASLEKNEDVPEDRPSRFIATSRSAQMQFKTAMVNHVDLSSQADNKANIMLSVNAIILTYSLPVLPNTIKDHPNLLIPSIILITVCLLSVIFAALATRPMPTSGRFRMEDIINKKTNIFFFGNFHQMKYEDYEKAVQYVVEQDERLDTSFAHSLFSLGKVLGKKFNYLRICYLIFMYGFIVTAFAFAVAILLG